MKRTKKCFDLVELAWKETSKRHRSNTSPPCPSSALSVTASSLSNIWSTEGCALFNPSCQSPTIMSTTSSATNVDMIATLTTTMEEVFDDSELMSGGQQDNREDDSEPIISRMQNLEKAFDDVEDLSDMRSECTDIGDYSSSCEDEIEEHENITFLSALQSHHDQQKHQQQSLLPHTDTRAFSKRRHLRKEKDTETTLGKTDPNIVVHRLSRRLHGLSLITTADDLELQVKSSPCTEDVQGLPRRKLKIKRAISLIQTNPKLLSTNNEITSDLQ